MEIKKKDLQYTAALAKLSIDDKLEQYTSNLTKIVHYIEKMNEVNTDSVTLAPTNASSATVRTDNPINTQDNKLVTLGPHVQDNYYLVPKVID